MKKITSQRLIIMADILFFKIIKYNIFASNTSKENTKTNMAPIEIKKNGDL